MAERQLEVRRASPADVPAIARVHVNSWRVAYRGQIPGVVLAALDLKQREQHWRRILQSREPAVLVAVLDGGVVGFCHLIASRDPDVGTGVGEIASIYVDPPHWRGGVGGALLQAGIEAACRRGCHTLTLWVLSSNTPAHRFYERFGFALDGQSKLESRQDYSLHEIRYRLRLSEPDRR